MSWIQAEIETEAFKRRFSCLTTTIFIVKVIDIGNVLFHSKSIVLKDYNPKIKAVTVNKPYLIRPTSYLI